MATTSKPTTMLNILFKALPADIPSAAEHTSKETVLRTLPIFLYNSLMVSEASPFMGLNLFEPRYRCLCERICANQIPPYILFVPNFHDYIPKPGDASFVVHITECKPSQSGQYSLRGQLVTTRRVIELSWLEPNTGNLWWALTSPLGPVPVNGSNLNYECDAIKFAAAISRDKTNLLSSGWATNQMNQHIYTEHAGNITKEGVNRRINYQILVTNNHRDWQQSSWLAGQIHVRSLPSSALMQCIKCGSITREEMQSLRERNIAKAKEFVLSNLQKYDAEHVMDQQAITVLKDIPIVLPLVWVVDVMRNNFSLHDDLERINRLIVRFRLTPMAFFMNDNDVPTGGELYGHLPHATITLERPNGNSQQVAEYIENCRNECFPYYSFIQCTNYRYLVHITQDFSVSFYVAESDVMVQASAARHFLVNVAKEIYWPSVRLLFINGSGTKLHRLPLAVIRHISSFFLFQVPPQH